MTILRDFFDRNAEMVIFAYGLVFFVLGLAIALQSRQRSRLHLARSLGWLSFFGITHGLHEWGMIFIPIQATYMNYVGITLLQLFQLILLAVSFLALFAFGADMVRDRWPGLQLLPFAAAGVWALLTFLAALLGDAGIGLWLQQADIWARYLLAVPGALLAAYGLRYQAARQIRPLGLESIYNMLRIAGASLVAYAFFAGLVVPYGPFFPANWLNQSLIFEALGVPVPVFRSLVGLVFAVAIVRAMEVFEVETDRLIEQMQLEQSLAAERERIGRELHDGAIQIVYTAGLLMESARSQLDDDSIAAQRLDRAITAQNEAINSLRTYMSDLRTEPAKTSLVEGLQQQAADPRLTSLLEVDLALDLPPEVGFNPAQVAHILAIVGEALANAVRHAQASRVQVRATAENGRFLLGIADDGVGFAVPAQESGYGLRNMRDRARLLGGELTIDSDVGRGTVVTLSLPWENE